MQHRIVVVDTLAELPVEAAQRHWRERHPGVYLPAPLLAGYVQNRPLEEEWDRLGTRSICSETWFADHAAERSSFTSDYYRDVVMPDESAFLDRGSAWFARVVSEPGPQAVERYRVLGFGTEALAGHGAERLPVDRRPWAGGAQWVESLWLGDRARALELARAADGLAFAAEPVVFRDPAGG